MAAVKVTDSTFLIWEKHWLKEWDSLDVSDRKVLAALYWPELTDKQKQTFTDHEYIEFMQMQERKKKDLVNDPVRMKAYFLMEASPLLDKMIQAALGNQRLTSQDAFATAEVWTLLREIISEAKSPAPLLDLKGKQISEQIDEILTNVSSGEITFDQAKNYMSLVSSGYNLQELPKLMAKLDSMESN